MISTGLVSVTFRRLSPQEIVTLVKQSGQQGIEWGGDIHVPHGNLAVARQVAAMTQEAGLEIPSYGSYYRVGVSPHEGLAFETVLETALTLRAPTIRVWAGKRGSAEIDAEGFSKVVTDAQRSAALAHAAGVSLSFEFHPNTLTDTPASALRLYREIAQNNVFLYWQPPVELTEAEQLQGLRQVLPHLSHLHVYHCTLADGHSRRHPLSEGRASWQQFLQVAAESGRDHFALLEFVVDDSPDQYLADAATLSQWLTEEALR